MCASAYREQRGPRVWNAKKLDGQRSPHTLA